MLELLIVFVRALTLALRGHRELVLSKTQSTPLWALLLMEIGVLN